MRLLVDNRYRGTHGIGRYAAEVVPRLGMPWEDLGLDGTPFTAWDAFRRLRNPGAQGSPVYSPGYGPLLHARRQVLTLHDLIQLQTRGLERAKFTAYYAGPVRHVVRRTGVVLTVSETSAKAIRAWVADDAVEIINAGNGCSDAFVPRADAQHVTDPYLIYVGNGRAHKNLDVVLDALALAPDLHLMAVVPEREMAELEARAARRDITSQVRWVSNVDDDELADLYRGAAATVMPSTIEGFGLPALESIRCGVPVLYWAGCEAVAEIVGCRGQAIASVGDAHEWSEAMALSVGDERRVDPPYGYDWDRTARIVSDTLSRFVG